MHAERDQADLLEEPMTEKIKVMIADDHPVVRKGIRTLIESEPDMELIGEAVDGANAVELADELDVDIILMDLLMPVKDGIEAIKEIKAKKPDIRILVLTSYADDDKVLPAIRAGALGYLLKVSDPEELVQAIREIYRGEPSLHPSIARKLVLNLSESKHKAPLTELLTEREVDVLKLVSKGLSNKDIAQELFISVSTTRSYVTTILNKLNVENRTQAALYALREGLVSIDDE